MCVIAYTNIQAKSPKWFFFLWSQILLSIYSSYKLNNQILLYTHIWGGVGWAALIPNLRLYFITIIIIIPPTIKLLPGRVPHSQ